MIFVWLCKYAYRSLSSICKNTFLFIEGRIASFLWPNYISSSSHYGTFELLQYLLLLITHVHEMCCCIIACFNEGRIVCTQAIFPKLLPIIVTKMQFHKGLWCILDETHRISCAWIFLDQMGVFLSEERLLMIISLLSTLKSDCPLECSVVWISLDQLKLFSLTE